jgi:hypothetical protein
MTLLTIFLALTLSTATPSVAIPMSQQRDAAAPETGAKNEGAKTDDAKVIAEQLPSYPLTACPVSNEPLPATKAVDVVRDGRLVRLCCPACTKELDKDPATLATVFKAIDAGVIQAQKDSYPLDTCAVSGEKLGSMGDPIELVQGTRLIRLCCKGCVKGAKKDPAKVLAPIDAALIVEQTKTYPLTTCLVDGTEMGAQGVDRLYGVRLTRFCSDACGARFAQEPAKYVVALDKAAPKKN